MPVPLSSSTLDEACVSIATKKYITKCTNFKVSNPSICCMSIVTSSETKSLFK